MTDRVVTQLVPQAVVELRGEIAPDLAEYTRQKVAGVLRHTGRAVLHVHIQVERHRDPARQRPVTARANVDLDGMPVSVHVAATKPRDAVDQLVERLDHRLERVSRARHPRRERPDTRNGAELRTDAHGPHHPAAERDIVRHTTISPQRCSIDDAVAEMDDQDLDFHLFVEESSGQDAVVYRDGPATLRLAQIGGGSGAIGPHTVALTVSPHPAPLLDTAEAANRLEMAGLPFVFYLDGDHGRANVIYHRYDGHYGLIDPPGHGG
jgi:ribosome-associated translation inhibitor RaiA